MNPFQFISLLLASGGGLISFVVGIIKHRKIAVQIGSILSMTVSTIVIIGHLIQDPKIYKIPQDQVGMSLLSALIFFILSGGMLVVINNMEFKDPKSLKQK